MFVESRTAAQPAAFNRQVDPITAAAVEPVDVKMGGSVAPRNIIQTAARPQHAGAAERGLTDFDTADVQLCDVNTKFAFRGFAAGNRQALQDDPVGLEGGDLGVIAEQRQTAPFEIELVDAEPGPVFVGDIDAIRRQPAEDVAGEIVDGHAPAAEARNQPRQQHVAGAGGGQKPQPQRQDGDERGGACTDPDRPCLPSARHQKACPRLM